MAIEHAAFGSYNGHLLLDRADPNHCKKYVQILGFVHVLCNGWAYSHVDIGEIPGSTATFHTCGFS